MTEERPLGDLLKALIDYRGKTPMKSTSGIPLITAKVIKDGSINEADLEYVSEETYCRWMTRGFPKQGDILITTEAPLGEIAQLRTDSRVALAQRVILLRADADKINPQFLFHFLRSPLAQARLRQRSSGTTVSGIRQPELRAVRVPCPPRPDQFKIGLVLDALDCLVASNRRRIELLEQITRAIYSEWFVHFCFPGGGGQDFVNSSLGSIPSGWAVESIGWACSYLNRGIAPKYSEDGPYLVINQKCIRDGRVSLKRARRQSKSVMEEKLISFGDVLINSTGVGTLGRVAQFYQELENTTVDSHVTIARPGRDLAIDWFGLSLLALQPIFEASGVGSTGQTELNREAIGRQLLLVPPAALQRRFGDVVGSLRRLSGELAMQAECVKSMRDSLLPKLVTGQIDVAPLDIDSLL